MPDPRWNDPNQVPLSNGPIRLTTPPAAITARLSDDACLIEFLLPFPMHIVDGSPWAALQCRTSGGELFIHKPISIVQPFEPVGRVGNESPETFCSIVRTISKQEPAAARQTEPAEVWSLVEAVLGWIRVKARHYWIPRGDVGFGALYRGSLLSQKDKQIAQRNFCSYGRVLIVRPLDQALWLSIGNELSTAVEVPMSDSIFCDALCSAIAGDEMKALLELGVAAEIEITQLLINTSRRPPDTAEKREFIANEGDWDKFGKKLETWPQELGLQEAKTFNAPGIFKDWVPTVRELYRLRNSVAHSGKLRHGLAVQNVNSYIFAANALFAYCREQRASAGITDYSWPASRKPFDQIVGMKDGDMFAQTSSVVTIFG